MNMWYWMYYAKVLHCLAKLVDGFYAELQHAGAQRSDTSILIKRLHK